MTISLPRELMHLAGPFSIQIFGVMVLIALALFAWLVQRDKLAHKLMPSGLFDKLLLIGIALGVIGGRALYVLINWNALAWWEMIAFWQGGVALLGTTLALIIGLPLVLQRHHIPVLPFCDLLALYLPLTQAITRVGCFFAGCCFGKASSLPWAVTYANIESIAPCGIALHPVQLYSALSLGGMFVALHLARPFLEKIPGQLTCLYIMLLSTERFCMDFFRADHQFAPAISTTLTVHQLIAILLFISSAIGLIIVRRKHVSLAISHTSTLS